jgi:hypothetical protein
LILLRFFDKMNLIMSRIFSRRSLISISKFVLTTQILASGILIFSSTSDILLSLLRTTSGDNSISLVEIQY